MLTKIVEKKKHEVARLELPQLRNVPKYSFYEALMSPKRSLGVIAEMKKASPSKGVLKENFSPIDIGADYEKAGVDCISVLTDQSFFKGSTLDLITVKELTQVPVLRKDFIIDRLQIEESVRIGADAILLIAEILTDDKLLLFYNEATDKGLDVLVEVHSLERLFQLLQTLSPKIIGVNNRNLQTFETNIKTTKQLAEHIPDNSLLVSESGILTHEDLKEVAEYGANAVLVGEAFMKDISPGVGVKRLFGELEHV
ncbi:indole-3-glycerol phosphate synthase TrpC [Sutcliffiella rhizosphaerae]|uniref:Indole-3-glycerol phosphate synthase n=1 Tax=Sutcliffiella rhizosphaerae TaxID=2880967 RepID=A0ABM8YRW1_9BACI|nr:indole-3-glycerol phosphate synthase TrpC [Sutcliffiella rhizosphaerae]CAG9622651.1 Indole-3-glycerol phosphate synthase [Sutcliffiella rhizosphaerae]